MQEKNIPRTLMRWEDGFGARQGGLANPQDCWDIPAIRGSSTIFADEKGQRHWCKKLAAK